MTENVIGPPKKRTLVDKNGTIINPSTEDTLHEILRALKMSMGMYTAITQKVFIANDLEQGIANNDYVYYLITPSANTPVYLKNVEVASEGDMLITVYDQPDITDVGEAVTVIPANAAVAQVPQTQITKFPSWNDTGTAIEYKYIAGNGAYAFPVKPFENRVLRDQFLIAIQNVSGNNLKYLTLTMVFAEDLEVD